MSRNEVFRAATRLLYDGLPIDICIAFEVDASGSELRGCASAGWKGDCRSLRVDPSGDSFAARALRAQMPIALDDFEVAAGAQSTDESLSLPGVITAIGLPIRAGDISYGAIIGYSRTARPFDQDIQFIEAIAGVISVAADRDRAQRLADSAALRVADVLNSVVEHFVHVDRQWNITFVNASAAELFSVKPVAMIGKPVAEWFPSFLEPERRRYYEAAMLEGTPGAFDFRSSLNKRWYEARVRPTSEGIGVFYLDITARRDAEEARLRQELRTRVLIDNVPAITWRTDADLTFISSVGGGLRELGLEADALAGKRLRNMFADGATLRAHERALGGEATDYQDSFGGRTYISHVEPLRENDAIVGVAGLAIDVTEQLRAEHRLEDAQVLAQFGAWSFDIASGERTFSDELLRIFGRPIENMPATPQDFSKLVHADDAQRVRQVIRHAALSGRPWKVDHRIVCGDGSIRHVENVGRCVLDDGRLVRSYGSVLDITERKLAENELVRLATFDVLTDLPNRTQLTARIARALGEADENGKLVAVCCIDVDRFKTVNHTLGHEAGDVLLKAVGERLSSVCRTGDVVGRLGSDEFVIVFTGIASEDESGELGENVRSAFATPFDVLGRDMFVTLSAGLSFYPKDGADADMLLRSADTALEEAKAAGGDQTEVFRPEMGASDGATLDLRNGLYRALQRNEFLIYYQPITECASRRLIGFEALLRWQHPLRGLVPPNDFIPLAEQTGLIIPIGEWVLRQACAHARKWRGDGSRRYTVSVNLSARQFTDKNLLNIVSGALSECDLDPADLCLEVTESAVIRDLQNGAAILRSLGDLGVTVAIDDFGTGYSSLNYLRSFAFDTLKIDRSFVQGLPRSGADATIARAILALGHALGVKVTAEGVETEEQASFLGSEGCDSLQGYLLSKPVPEYQVSELIARHR
ncbi:MAG TPA: EAL domain-containing protein [Candidatus Eremiobacteraceae bacterium]|nr:EAL domain-containing protein [Candidatus Eremiobacteraceae bacterium]